MLSQVVHNLRPVVQCDNLEHGEDRVQYVLKDGETVLVIDVVQDILIGLHTIV